MAIELVRLGTLTITMGETLRLAGTPAGDRIIVEFPAIAFDGERLRAKLRGNSAADWLVIGARGRRSSTFASPSRPTTAR